jgi:hypothetical protein
MTKRTHTALTSHIASILPDNVSGAISPSDVREAFDDSHDSVVFWDNSIPSSATDTCVAGEMKFGSVTVESTTIHHLYVCVETNVWRRMELTTF